MSDFELVVFDLEAQRRLDECVGRLQTSRKWGDLSPWGFDYESGCFERVSGDLGEVEKYLHAWVQQAIDGCAGLVADPILPFQGHVVRVYYDRSSVEIAPEIVGDDVRCFGTLPSAAAMVRRRKKGLYEVKATNAEAFAKWAAYERWVFTTPLEELRAAGAVIDIDQIAGSYRTPGHSGETLYTED